MVTLEEAAELAGVSVATLRAWIARGWIAPVRFGVRPLRFRYDDVAAAQRSHRPRSWQARHARAVAAFGACVSGEK
jgi:excisionase family DNA binding protein